MKWAIVVILGVAATASAASNPLRGRFYWGHEVNSFHPCGSSKAYWVAGEESAVKLLRRRTDALHARRGEPYQPVYVVVVGEIDTVSAREGFAESYDGLVYIRKVARASDAVPKDCAQ